MELTILGSSDAFCSTGRGHAAYLVRDPGLPYLAIDFGATALAALHRAGLGNLDLGAVAITHLHGDHFGGLPFLLLDGMYHRPRTAALPLLGPPGFTSRLAALDRALYHDLADRPRPFPTPMTELVPGAAASLAGYRIEAFAADHMDPPDVALCLRVTGPSGKVISFSGDTVLCPGLRAVADGADLLVAECTGLRPPCGRHLTWNDWRHLLPELTARRIVLSHLSTEMRAAIPELAQTLLPELAVIFADDGMTLGV